MQDLIVIRGAGDLATGLIQKFHRAGFRVLALETEQPLAIRRSVALCSAVYQGHMQVEDIRCQRIDSPGDAQGCWAKGEIPLLIDPNCESLPALKPDGLVDAIIAKKNLGTSLAMAPITIAVGPGFCAGRDVNLVIESMRGHDLGRLIMEGYASPNTGTPGEIGGKSAERVIHAPRGGKVLHHKEIGDLVEKGQAICSIEGEAVRAPFTGLLRGLIQEGLTVKKGLKIADIDPRCDVDWRTISDKARCIGGAALEAYLFLRTYLESLPNRFVGPFSA